MRETNLLGLIMKFVLHARSTEVGSRTLVHATDAGPESHGKYLADCMVRDPAPFVTSAEGVAFQARWWKELSGKLETLHPGVLSNF